jgi:hypothetical protein
MRELSYRIKLIGCVEHTMATEATASRNLPVSSPTPERLARHAELASHIGGREVCRSFEDEAYQLLLYSGFRL